VLEKVGQAMQKILADESLKQQLSSRGSESSPTTPAALRSFIQVEIERWGQAIKRSGTTVD
jgi:tripartite-type tricarboxylate transporter receptor subunit TctC